MSTSVLVGVDIGTSSAKGAAYDPDGRALGTVEIAYRHETPRRGWAEADATAWWRATCRILRSLAATARPAPADGAPGAPAYDCRTRAWSPEMGGALGVEPAWLPEIKPSHAIAGRVTAAAARETGLREGPPVAVGGADFAASTLAAGVTEPGEACLMLGTAGNLIMPLAAPDFDTRLINSHHVGCDRYLALGGTLSGALQEWFRSIAAPGAPFDTLDAEAAAVPAGADGLRLLPYLQGERTPVWDAGACGAFVGLSLVHGRGHLSRAVLEGVAAARRHRAGVAAEKGLALRQGLAVHGGARSAVC